MNLPIMIISLPGRYNLSIQITGARTLKRLINLWKDPRKRSNYNGSVLDLMTQEDINPLNVFLSKSKRFERNSEQKVSN